MADPPPDGAGAAGRIVVACLVATISFWAYTQTLLPGVDLGDTGGFQAAVLWPAVSARQAYPLYYNLATPFVRVSCGSRLQPEGACNPARALNLFSAVCAAIAVGLLAYLTAAITGSLAGGAVAGLLLAFSYTFWTQAIIAEVYALHLALVAACFIALHHYASRPTRARLAVFFALYALSFGNHLSMILFLPAFTACLLLTTPERRSLFRLPVVAMAAIIAIAGALQYWPNFAAAAFAYDAPPGWGDKVSAFWFDTTKADWREQMVLGIEGNQTLDRLAMWGFDARQQFGLAGLALALIGAVRLWMVSPTWGAVVTTAFAVTTTFALTYNVGDSHVFFLPSSFLAALCAGAAVWREPCQVRAGGPDKARPTSRFAPQLASLPALLAILYCAWWGWSTWPAVDRHDDRRGEQLITQLTFGVNDPDTMLVSQMNWQLENVLLYMGRHQRPDLTWTRLGDVLPHFPFLVEDQRAIARDVVLTADAAAETIEAYGSRFAFVEDTLAAPSLAAQAERIAAGRPYVLSLLTPLSEVRLDEADLDAAIRALTGGKPPSRTPGAFELIAGVTGQRPTVYRSERRPFTVRFELLDEPFTVRMDSWLPSDTFRRPGFGHVLRRREHVQILERGVNLVWVREDGGSAPPVYAASLFAPQRRFRLPAGVAPALARLDCKSRAIVGLEAAYAAHTARP